MFIVHNFNTIVLGKSLWHLSSLLYRLTRRQRRRANGNWESTGRTEIPGNNMTLGSIALYIVTHLE